jgi:hypothetical protein
MASPERAAAPAPNAVAASRRAIAITMIDELRRQADLARAR